MTVTDLRTGPDVVTSSFWVPCGPGIHPVTVHEHADGILSATSECPSVNHVLSAFGSPPVVCERLAGIVDGQRNPPFVWNSHDASCDPRVVIAMLGLAYVMSIDNPARIADPHENIGLVYLNVRHIERSAPHGGWTAPTHMWAQHPSTWFEAKTINPEWSDVWGQPVSHACWRWWHGLGYNPTEAHVLWAALSTAD